MLKKRYQPEDFEKYNQMWQTKDYVDQDKCVGCKACLRCGCPSLVYDADRKKVQIDENTCVGCDVCLQICPYDAIQKVGE